MYNKKGVIAVDVDLTVCAIDRLWIAWLNMVSGEDYTLHEFRRREHPYEVPYNLGEYYPNVEDSLEFFRGESIYDDAKTVDDSRHVLYKLSEKWDIVFVSTCKGNHHKSKYYWLKKNFHFMSGFIATKEKHYVAADVFIDDRNDVLNNIRSYNKECRVIKFNTPYKQSEPLVEGIECYMDWMDILWDGKLL